MQLSSRLGICKFLKIILDVDGINAVIEQIRDCDPYFWINTKHNFIWCHKYHSMMNAE